MKDKKFLPKLITAARIVTAGSPVDPTNAFWKAVGEQLDQITPRAPKIKPRWGERALTR